MLKMQDDNGGVYHKVTGLAFPDAVMPTEETSQLYIMPVSITATGDFCAVMAMASKVYEPIDQAFAKQCLNASLKAWGYLDKNNGGSFKNPADVLTGEYGDGQNADERCWAAAALYKVTGKTKYNDAFIKYLNLVPFVLDGYGWSNVGGYGNRIYLSLEPEQVDAQSVAKIKEAMATTVASFYTNAEKDGYGGSLGKSYPWGSNMSVCNNVIYMRDAGGILGKDYSDLINSHFNYIFGANSMSTCYVTGLGTTSPKYPHHRPSMFVGKVMPGMLVGGPNSNLEDPFAKAVLVEASSAKCYADNAQSFSCNEVAVYWNSALVYLIAQHISE
jgi:endoglucanase